MSDSLSEEISGTCSSLLATLELTLVDEEYDPEFFGNSLAVFENGKLRVRLIRDRLQVFADLASHSEPERWWDLYRALELLDGVSWDNVDAAEKYRLATVCDLLVAHYCSLAELFSPERYGWTRDHLDELGNRRAERLVPGFETRP